MSFKDIKKGILKMVLGEEASTTIEKNEKKQKIENLYSECKKLEYDIHTKETRLKYDIRELNFDIEMTKLKIEDIQTTAMTGIYSGTMDGKVVYLAEDAQHILVGSMFRLQDQKNLTQDYC